MAKVYRVMTLSNQIEHSDMFNVLAVSKWGSSLGEARELMNQIMDAASDDITVALTSVDAPASREDFVVWLNKNTNLSSCAPIIFQGQKIGEDENPGASMVGPF